MVALNLPIGANVLIGIAGVSEPDDWWPATVLWTDGAEVLVRQGGIAGATPHNALHDVDLVRAVGDRAFLLDFKARASAAAGEARVAVREAEQELGYARREVWRRIAAIGADRPGVEQPEAKAGRRRKAARKRIGIEEAA